MAPERAPTVELCVGAVVVDAGELLLVQRGRPPEPGAWSVPGGRVQPGERVAEAVVRELAEETGLHGACGDLIGWVERIDPAQHFVILDFAVTVAEPRPPTAGSDARAAAWVPLAEVARLPLVAGLARFLADHGIVAPITG